MKKYFIPTESNPHVVDNYPWGFVLQCTKKSWLEINKKGFRLVEQTIDPRNGRLNKPKKSAYYDLAAVFLDEKNHLKLEVATPYSSDKDHVADLINFLETQEIQEVKDLLRKFKILKHVQESVKVDIFVNLSPEESLALKQNNSLVLKKAYSEACKKIK